MRKLFDINTFSFFSLSHHALPFLIASKGNIMVVGSASGKVGILNAAPYSGTKHALFGHFEGFRRGNLVGLGSMVDYSSVIILLCLIFRKDT